MSASPPLATRSKPQSLSEAHLLAKLEDEWWERDQAARRIKSPMYRPPPSAASETNLRQTEITTVISRQKKDLRGAQKYRQRSLPNHYATANEIWLNVDMRTKKARAWESLNLLKACYLYGIRFSEVAKLARVAYRTTQYFLHNPDRVGYYSAIRLVIAGKILLGQKIMWLQEHYETTHERWNECDARKIEKHFYRSKEKSGATLN